MQKITLSDGFVGRNIVTLPHVSSTNDYLKEKLSNSEPFPEGTVIMAVHQSQGKGQQGTVWTSAPGENLTFSLLLQPVFLHPMEQFSLTMAISLAVVMYLKTCLPDTEQVSVKWPNDIYVNDRKIAGILIENVFSGAHWKHAVVGIGLNVNQQDFPESIRDEVTSMQLIAKQPFDLLKVLSGLSRSIETYYLKLKKLESADLFGQYVKNLYRFGVISDFYVDDVLVQGKICGVSPQGKLQIDFNSHVVEFDLKEVRFGRSSNPLQ